MRLISTTILIMFCFMIQHIHADEQRPIQIINENRNSTKIVIPINWPSQDNYLLHVTIPDGFQSIQPLADFIKDDVEMIEFIPQKENTYNWTEIITINKFMEKEFPASAITTKLRNGMLSELTNSKVWKESFSNFPKYQQSTLGISYDTQGKHEIFAGIFFSGGADSAGVQYTIRQGKINKNEKQIMKKIDTFFQNNIRLVPSN